jgi:hypothetical protein
VGTNGRLPGLLAWLEEAAPNVACLQELKAPDEKFPEAAIRAAGYGTIWHGEKSWTSRSWREALSRGKPAGLTRRSRRYARPLHRSGDRRDHRRMPLSAKWQSRAGAQVQIHRSKSRSRYPMRADLPQQPNIRLFTADSTVLGGLQLGSSKYRKERTTLTRHLRPNPEVSD